MQICHSIRKSKKLISCLPSNIENPFEIVLKAKNYQLTKTKSVFYMQSKHVGKKLIKARLHLLKMFEITKLIMSV